MGFFHQKVGILHDSVGNKLSFSGSENESAFSWEKNIEEFKVFRNWVDEEIPYFNSDQYKFEKFWNGFSIRTKVFDLPDAVKKQIIKIAPDNFEDLQLNKWYTKVFKSRKIVLRGYQNLAVQKWESNNYQGIFEMATGTGKTITALSCVKKIFLKERYVVVIICSPFIHLSEQWLNESEKVNINCYKIIADSSRYGWRDKVVDNLIDVENDIIKRLIILTTHNTFSSKDFIKLIKESKKRASKIKYFMIVDEVHGIGAPKRKIGLLDEYDYRLGLSATPKRWFDYEGTEKIFRYFNDVVFEFSLEKAINLGYLTNYIYKPYFTTLTQNELDAYQDFTKKISRMYYSSKDDEEKEEIFSLLCINRQKIIRNANNKLLLFEKILDEINTLSHCLIYCSPQQIKPVQNILNRRNIIQHKFTQKEGTKSEEKFGGLSERDFLLKQFSEGIYHALVSMRCLDEGVDVPPARLAIMLDNSGNPKEYIQRRGRILRKFPGKEHAIINDIIVEPGLIENEPELLVLEKKVLSKEFLRYKEFARSALNASECLQKLKDMEILYGIR